MMLSVLFYAARGIVCGIFLHLQRASIEFRDVAKSYGDHRC